MTVTQVVLRSKPTTPQQLNQHMAHLLNYQLQQEEVFLITKRVSLQCNVDQSMGGKIQPCGMPHPQNKT